MVCFTGREGKLQMKDDIHKSLQIDGEVHSIHVS